MWRLRFEKTLNGLAHVATGQANAVITKLISSLFSADERKPNSRLSPECDRLCVSLADGLPTAPPNQLHPTPTRKKTENSQLFEHPSSPHSYTLLAASLGGNARFARTRFG